MALRTSDLRKVADHPEVKAAIEAQDEAMEALREAGRALSDANRALDERNDELEAVVKRVLGTAEPSPADKEHTDA